MCRWIAALDTWCRRPFSGGFEALDIQIDKMRILRDSYQIQSEISFYDTATGISGDRNPHLNP